jgi:hypothetical protein
MRESHRLFESIYGNFLKWAGHNLVFLIWVGPGPTHEQWLSTVQMQRE